MQSVALMERQGIPIDTETLGLLRDNWDIIRSQLIDRIDVAGVYTEGSFSEKGFEQYLAANGVPWPRLQSGRLALDKDTFRQQARSHSRFIAKYHELRSALSKLNLNSLAVGPDGRNYSLLSALQRLETSRATQSSSLGHLLGSEALSSPKRIHSSPT